MLSVGDILLPPIRVPPPLQPNLPLYLRCPAQLIEWEELNDTYAAAFIRDGLLLDWVEGFDPVRPADDFRPRS